MTGVEDAERDSSTRRAARTNERRSKVTGRRLLQGVLAATTLGWAAVGLVLGFISVLPTPNLGLLGPNAVLDSLAMLVQGYSLLLAAIAVIGIALALLARRAELRRASRAGSSRTESNSGHAATA
jgi:hypothetical protein